MRRPRPVPASQFYPFPPELWAVILDCVPAETLQSTALALSRAIPQANVSLIHLCRHLKIQRAKQLRALIVRLNHDVEGRMVEAIKTLNVADWLADENIVAILLNKLSSSAIQLRQLRIHLGPTWSPEALREGLAFPFKQLQHLALRFNLSSLVKNYVHPYSMLPGLR